MEELSEDLADILDELPHDEIIDIVVDHILKDVEVMNTVNYAFSPEMDDLLMRVVATPEAKAFENYFDEAGYSLSDLNLGVDCDDDLKKKLRLKNRIAKSTGGVKALLDDIFAILPVEALQKVAAEKMEEENFSGFIALFKTDEFKTLLRAAAQSPVIQAAYQELLENHIDPQDLVKRIDAIFPGVYETLVGPLEH